MINEISEGAKISFMDKKESDLEKKVRKLEQDMLHLDSILNNEKFVRKKSLDDEKLCFCDPSKLNNQRSFKESGRNLAKGDGPDPWEMMQINIHRNSNTSQVQPDFFFTWDCSPYDFHNNSAQRSIYTLLDQWNPGGTSMSADQFKKQLSALLAANKEITAPADLVMNQQHDLNVITGPSEKLGPYICKIEPDIKNPNIDIEKSDFDAKELLANLEKKLKEVETKCRDEYVKVVNPMVNKTKNEENVASPYERGSMKFDQDSAIIDDLIFEMFKESNDGFGKKPIELSKEVDDLQGLLSSYNQAEDSLFRKLDTN